MNVSLPANFSKEHARLPATYEQAKVALSQCVSIDECQDWADKAEALASYAKQADDDTLRKMADRIQARAVRRCGELLKQFDGRGRPAENKDGTVPNISQKEAAERSGIGERQRKTAVAVASLDADQFDAAVESDTPPTVTKLAEMGKQSRPSIERPAGFQAATQLIGTVERFAEFCRQHDPETTATAVMEHELAKVRKHVSTIDAWLDRFVVNLKG